ncbi:MAG: hybrid sensor histidine kinase/response regulator [Sphingobacteriaceae bacterium]|jgi:signal transduction histidine kinase|nr:hybrid sensor histidine kinase/response regulator [Sphingobacteriaceae bacterium]
MILIVDDKPENIFSLKQLLDLNGFETDTALSGEEALVKILKTTYSLIILDVQMPGMDGFEVAETISGYSRSKDIPIIFLSAVNTDKKFIARGYASGGIDYVTKPVDADILMLKVKTFHRLYEQKLELIKIQRELKSEIEFRKQAEAKKDEFISIASHELKTPLTSIKGYVYLLDRTIGNSDANGRKYIERTKTQIEKLNNLITDLLDVSKIESGKIEFNYKHFRFNDLLTNTVEIIRQTNEGCTINVSNNTDIDIYGDEMRIEQVLINYFTNAIKYSPESNEIYVTCQLTPDNDLKVSVKDFGIGIDEQKQRQVFQKYFRAEDTSYQFQGLGIGLYICSEILERHNGKYGVQSEPGKGSTFYFTLPLASEQKH